MFLNAVQRRNPGLLEAALKLHRDHRLPPNTYVLDLDGLEANARALAAAARAEGLSLYFMTKQLNRNPRVMQTVAAAGITRGVAVDIDDARAFRQAGVTLGHVGHLVQIPRAHLPQVLSWRPEVMTVFSLANARAVSEAAVALGRRQDVLLRLAGQEVFPGQEGGVDWDDLPSVAREVVGLPGVRLAGLTAFPCLLAEDGRPTPTPNLALLSRAARLLRDDVGLDIGQVNAPSLTCCSTLPLLRQAGATHGEPGHALTGSGLSVTSTTYDDRGNPLQVIDPNQVVTAYDYVYIGSRAEAGGNARHSLKRQGKGFHRDVCFSPIWGTSSPPVASIVGPAGGRLVLGSMSCSPLIARRSRLEPHPCFHQGYHHPRR